MTEKDSNPAWTPKFSIPCACCSLVPRKCAELKLSYKVRSVLATAWRGRLMNRDPSQRGRQGLGPFEARNSGMRTGLPGFSSGTSKFFAAI